MSDDSLVDRLCARLRDMLADGDVLPGSRINESALSRDLNASRTPLREALNRLVGSGMIDARAGNGFYAAGLTADGQRDLLALRAAIEVEAARQTLAQASDAEIGGFVTKAEAMEPIFAAGGDPARLCEMDEAFHAGLCALSRNAELATQLARLTPRLRYLRRLALSSAEGIEHAAAEHRTLVVDLGLHRDRRLLRGLRQHIEAEAQDLDDRVTRALGQMHAASQPA